MKKSLFIIALLLFTHCAFSQNFTTADVTKTFKGLTGRRPRILPRRPSAGTLCTRFMKDNTTK